MLRAGSVFPTPGKASASGSPETQPCPASSKGKVLRKFLVLPVILINYVLRVFIYPCSSSWSSEDSVPCSRGAPGLDSFLAGVEPERFPILCKGEISRGGAFKPRLLRYTHFVLGRFFSWNTVNFSIGICENKGAKTCGKLEHQRQIFCLWKLCFLLLLCFSTKEFSFQPVGWGR